ncbi:MAG: succinylglutamate desuccinylase/aspartoacylase family protein [Rhizobiales bacterium]|nr:succinylglutamate desuccinylase/aspartoacylase family protein [Hyphomicrobiales bacterium]MBI3673733.1 succinylglutamate desuccinylase/aspartoacylase family protein [Hyphomicrobiales bacterium]
MKPFVIGNHEVERGTRAVVDLPVSVLSNNTPMTLPVHVLHGARPGPVLFVSGVVHGDEIQGVEIVRRLLRHKAMAEIAGTLLAIPIVNAFGFLNHSRYMPDRRDLNRSFPGSDKGSLASLLADLFMREVVQRSHYGIDLHTAGINRANLPQIRIAPDEPDLLALAETFGAPVVLVSKLREGTLRHCARELGVKMLLYEAGEALRFDEMAIRAGVLGILRVMKSLAMVGAASVASGKLTPALSHTSTWLRAPEGGILRSHHGLGDRVTKGEALGEISDPVGQRSVRIVSDGDGLIVGATNLPVVNRGDALYHVARMKDPETSRDRVKGIGSALAQAMLDEDEII